MRGVSGRAPNSDNAERPTSGRDLLRRRRRPLVDPAAARRGPRLRQPGARARPVAARLGRRRAGRPAGGSESRAKAEDDGLRVLTPAEACEEADLIMVLVPDHLQRAVYAEAIAPRLVDGRRAVLRARPEHPLRPHPAAGGRGRLHGGAEGPRPPGPPPVQRGPRRAGARRGRAGRDRQRAGRSRSPTPRASAAPAPACSRPRSPRRPRPTCSASRPCCAAASPS